MDNPLSLTILALLALGYASPALSADPGATGDASPNLPRKLGAADLQKLYGEREIQIDSVVPGGKVRFDVKPDGVMFGNNDSLIGSKASYAANSSGKWRVDADAGRVCHEWENKHWKNACFAVLEVEPNVFEWSSTGRPGGTRFSVTPK